MTATGLIKKRKQVDAEVQEPGSFAEAVGLEMLSDEKTTRKAGLAQTTEKWTSFGDRRAK